MKLSKEEYEILYKKLEYRFKNSDHELVDKIKDCKSLSNDDIEILLKKLEYTFRKSENPIILKLQKEVDLENQPTIKYSNLKAKKKRDEKEKQKEDQKIIKKFKDFK